jgi:K+/H+ antiporter YhaU regulatory subunit KhtT
MPAPEMLRIRMLKSAATVIGVFRAGEVIMAPAKYARPWLASGLAEQDKMVDGPPETKA